MLISKKRGMGKQGEKFVKKKVSNIGFCLHRNELLSY